MLLWTKVLSQNTLNIIYLLNANPQNGQTHSNNSSAVAEEFFGCVWLFYRVGA